MKYPDSEDILELFHRQLDHWEMAKNNFQALSSVKVKDFDFGKFSVKVQFNPARIQSSSAKVDAKSIQERRCFLCKENRPPEQEGARFNEHYEILVNPFPVFPQHFTIPTYSHTDQLIADRFGDMLDMAKTIDRFTFFYNGPKCGASAPDHAHFQAGIKGFLPIEKNIEAIDKTVIVKKNNLKIYSLNNYLRTGFLIEGTERDDILKSFTSIYRLLDIAEGDTEPMLNLLTWYTDNNWRCCIFPRKRHRPSCFFAEGEDNLMITPASVELGGVIITPLEKDFDKITKLDIQKIFEEVSMDNSSIETIADKLKHSI